VHRRLLVVEERQHGLLTLVAESAAADLADSRDIGLSPADVEVVTAVGTQEAAAALATDAYHCVVLDLDLPDRTAFGFLDAMQGDSALRLVPVLAHSSRRLDVELAQLVQSRADVHSLEVLSGLDELRERIALHLSAEEPGAVLPLVRPDEPAAPVRAADVDTTLAGRTVLIVDDDPRNVYALTGILELHGMQVLHAEDGRKGVETVASHPGIDLILMDVMMPEMDGYTATAKIRAMPQYAGLPIIAVTAKAMPGDREKSLASGATDYVTKPVDADDLIARIKRHVTA
jgi:CheY-like chemotaxis protein